MGSHSNRNESIDGYRFNLVNGQVSGLQEYDDGRWKNERIDRNESWSFDGTSLVKTESEKGRIKTSTFSDADSDGIYTRVGRDSVTGLSTSSTSPASFTPYATNRIAEDSYRFNLVNGQVSGLQEYDDGRWKNERIDRNESWSFDGTSLIQQEFKRYGTEVATFSDADGDGIFSKVSEVFNPVVTAAGAEVF